ncbi:hypothetical protein RchiOBHm_Chr1g0329111 [Rosa chinensis]|uniref:Uncharacterized protein n=1 Tax=Rosa chinensis TaxID=74649 RepID=A0A2P6SB00_ROSCH|nr:hypothetical protein RchiOBHm_Chr1g0329111 [Rosa chinensis]
MAAYAAEQISKLTEKSHIALMLQEITSRLRDASHVPYLDNVLLNVDEKEKEYLLFTNRTLSHLRVPTRMPCVQMYYFRDKEI